MLTGTWLDRAPGRQRRRYGHVQLVGRVAPRLVRPAEPALDLAVEAERLLGGDRRDEARCRRISAVVSLDELVAERLQRKGVPGAQEKRLCRGIGRPGVGAFDLERQAPLLYVVQQVIDRRPRAPVCLQRLRGHFALRQGHQPPPQGRPRLFHAGKPSTPCAGSLGLLGRTGSSGGGAGPAWTEQSARPVRSPTPTVTAAVTAVTAGAGCS